jgi:hypothetical protein
VNFINAPVVGRIAVTANTLDPRSGASTNSTITPGPGVPVDLDIVVYAKDNDTNPANDVPISDANVDVSTSVGFLSPNAESANAAVLATGHNAEGNLFGYYQNDGGSKTVSTGDAAQAGAVVAIERDAGFDDNGQVDATVTVKSGDVTTTVPVTFSSGVLLNVGSATLERASDAPAGDVEVGDEVGFNFVVTDQFGNRVGNEQAQISDDSTTADFVTDEDFDSTLSDFTTSGVGVVAFAEAPGVQTLLASMSPGQVLVGPAPANDPVSSNHNVTASSDPINWVAAPPVEKKPINLVAKGKNNGKKADVLKANANNNAAGLVAKVFVNGKQVAKHKLNSSGNWNFTIKDKNGKKVTKYTVKVAATATTMADSATKKLK